jgi:subtilisin family serine protease
MKLRVSRSGRFAIMLACLMVAGVSCAFAATALSGSNGPTYVPDEYIVQAVANAPLSAVQQSLTLVNGTLLSTLPLPDTYLVRLNRSTVGSPSGVVSAQSTYVPWVISSFSPNWIAHASVIPNDELWPKLWGMRSINMPQAWAVQKGSASVTVGLTDTGVAKHPDLTGRVLPGYDFVDGDSDPSNDLAGHGTHVAGTIAAQGDNTIGVCGVCWDGVKILPIRVLDENGSGSFDWIINGLEYALQHKVDVVNMSLGAAHGAVSPPLQAEIQKLAAAGIIICAAAGNEGMWADPGVGIPASYPECIAVAAIGPSDEIAPYSSYGPDNEVDIAAPGGNSYFGTDGMIWSTVVSWSGGIPTYDYDAYQGTSMACPHVSGAAALLLSAGVPPAEVRVRLEGTARKPKTGVMDKKKYGNGILDVSAALSNGSVLLTKPAKGSIVNGYPDFKASLRGIDPTSIAIYLDYGDGNGDGIPDNISTETPILAGIPASAFLNATQTAITFNYQDVSLTGPLAPGFHFVYITATTKVGGDIVYDWGTFTVASKIIPAGQYLYALPYGLTVTNWDGTTSVTALPSDLLIDATTAEPLDFRVQSAERARLIRWSAAQGYYVPYVTGLNPRFPGENVPKDDDRAWLNPVVRMLLTNGTIQPVPTSGGFLTDDTDRDLQFPAGAGFWLVLQRDAVISSDFTEISAPGGFSIYLYKGWNLIGNPYTRDVPLSAVHLTYHGQIRSFDEDQLSKLPWLDPNIYGYQSGAGYVRVPRDKRLLEPYHGYWVRALVGGISPQDSLIMTVQ